MNAPTSSATPGDTLLRVSDLKVHFPRAKQGWFKPPEVVRAVDGVSLEAAGPKTSSCRCLLAMKVAPSTWARKGRGGSPSAAQSASRGCRCGCAAQAAQPASKPARMCGVSIA